MATKCSDKGRERVVTAGERHVGDALALLQRGQGIEQTLTLVPGAEAQAGFTQEQVAQGLFRDVQVLILFAQFQLT